MKKRAWLYVRVKRDAGDDMVGLQADSLRKYAMETGIEIVGLSCDRCGGSGLDREGLKKASAAVSDGRANAILVEKADRIARNTDELAKFHLWMKGEGAELMSASEKDLGKALDTLADAVRAIERETEDN